MDWGRVRFPPMESVVRDKGKRQEMIDMEILDDLEMAEFDGCTGWKNPTECPHEGVFDPDSPACKECEEDAYEGMKEGL